MEVHINTLFSTLLFALLVILLGVRGDAEHENEDLRNKINMAAGMEVVQKGTDFQASFHYKDIN